MIAMVTGSTSKQARSSIIIVIPDAVNLGVLLVCFLKVNS